MNKIFKVIYSKTRHCYVVVSELAKSHCKTTVCPGKSKTALTAAVLLALGTFSFLGMPTAQAAGSLKNNDFVGANSTYWYWDTKISQWTTYDYKLGDAFNNRAWGDLPNYNGAGAKLPGAITAGLYAQAGQQTITIGDRNAGQSRGSVFIGEHSGYNNGDNVPSESSLKNNYVTAVGFQSGATGWGSIAIGSNAVAENTMKTDTTVNEVGEIRNPKTVSDDVYGIESNPAIEGASVALGYNAHAKDGNIAIGAYSEATDTSSTKPYVSVGNSTLQRRITNVADGAANTDAVTVGQMNKAIESAGVTGWTLSTNGSTSGTAIKSGTKVDFSPVVDGKNGTADHNNVKISNDGSKVTIGLNKDIVLGEATNGNGGSLNVYSDSTEASNLGNRVSIDGSTVSVNYGKEDGTSGTKRGVVLGVGEDYNNKAQGYIAFNNIDAKGTIGSTYLHSATDAPNDLKGRLVYSNAIDGTEYIANLDDGITFTTDSIKGSIGSNSIPMKLNQTYTFSGDFGKGKTTEDLSNGNIAVVAQHSIAMVPGGGPTTITDDGFTVKLAKDLKGITSIGNQTTKQDGDKEVTTGAKIVLNDNGTTTISGGNVNVSNNKITGLADGTANKDAVTVKQLNAVKNNTTDELAKKANVNASNIGAFLKGADGTSAASVDQITSNENDWGTALGTGSVTENNGQLVTGGTVYNALQQQKNDLTNKLSVNAGWGINIDKTKGNTISLKRNLGTNRGNTNKGTGKVIFEANGTNSLILGGQADTYDKNNIKAGTDGNYSVLVGGHNNYIKESGESAVIAGGRSNIASGNTSAVFGGEGNTASGDTSAVFGGEYNTASGEYSTVIGGGGQPQFRNNAEGNLSIIIGGYANDIWSTGNNSIIIGGHFNNAIGSDSIIIGGADNYTYVNNANIFGGYGNWAGNNTTVSGGVANITLSSQAYSASGIKNQVAGYSATSLGGQNQKVIGDYSTAIGGASTGKTAENATAIGSQAVVTAKNGLALGYKATADKEGTISFGHDKGDISGYNSKIKLEYGSYSLSDIQKYLVGPYSGEDTRDVVYTPTYYESAEYNRLVKVADGEDAHDTVVMEQLKSYTKSDASNIGAHLKTYTVGKDGETITEADATPEKQKENKDAWGQALGAGTFTTGTSDKATDASTSDQLVTGSTLYDYDKPTGSQNYVKVNNTTGQNLSALDAQVKANADELDKPNHNIKFYNVDDKILKYLPKVGTYSNNEANDGAKGMGSMAAGVFTHSDGIASTVAGSYSGILNQDSKGAFDLRGATALSYGTFNVNQNTDATKVHSGVANSIIGQVNMTKNSNATIIYGAGNIVTDSYRPIEEKKAAAILDSVRDPDQLGEAMKDAVESSGGQVMVMGGGNTVDKAYMTQVTGVGNKVTGQDSTYAEKTSTQYNFIDGFQNELTNGQHDYIIGSKNKINGDSVDKNQSNIIFGDNHKLTNQKNNVIIGSSDTADDETAASDVVAIGHNAKVSAEGGVAIGSGSEASVAGKTTEGYDPTTGKDSKDTTATWQATNAAVSIGKADGKVTRQLNGVAAGTKDTDAVNVAQLKKLEGMKANVDATNIGSKITVAPIYQQDKDGHDIIDQDGKKVINQKATEDAEKTARTANENAWGTAIGTGEIAEGNGQLVTGGKVYDALHGGLTDITIGKPGTAGKDGKDGEDGSIGLVGPKGENGKDGKTTTIIKTETGAAGVNGKDGKDGKDGITRIYYYDQTNTNDKHTVATLDDGMKYAGDTGDVANVKLDHQLKLSGTTFGADKTRKSYEDKDWTADNIAVVSNAADSNGNAVMSLKLAKDLKGLHSSTYTNTEMTGEGDKKQTTDHTTTIDGKGLTIQSKVTKDGKTEVVNGPSITKDGINGGGKQITNVGDGFKKNADGSYTISENDKKNAANIGDVQTIVDKATKDLTDGTNGLNSKANVNASNIGANLKDAGGKAASAEEITTNENAWGTAIGTGEVAKNNGQLVTGGKVYDALHGGLTDITIGKPGTAGKDGKDGEDGSIGLVGPKGENGKDGKTTTIIKTETGAAGVNGKDGKDGKDGITRIYYYDQTNTNDKHTVATLDDGMKYAGDTGDVANVKLDHQLKLSGTTFDEKDENKKYKEDDWTSDNIAVVSNAADKTTGDATMYLKLNKDLNLTDKGSVRFGDKNSSTTLDASGLTIKTTVTKDGKTETVNGPSMTKDGINGGGKQITNIGDGITADGNGKYTVTDENKGNAANISDVQNIVNDAKKDLTNGANGLNSKANVDASNIGENMKDAKGNKASAAEITKNKEAWASAIGTDTVAKGNKQLVTSDAVATALDSKADKTYVDEQLDTKANKSDVYTKDQTYSKSEVDSKVSDITNGLDGKAGKDLDNISDKGQQVIHNIAKDAVEVVDGTNTTVTKTDGTNTTPTKYAVNVEGKGKVASGDTGLISGGTLYNEVHIDKDGSYIKSGSTVGQNLSNLDTGLKTTSDLIHTNDKGDTIQIGGNSTATKIDVSGKDGKGNTTGRVITGVVSDANDPNSAANVGYVNGLTAANTQQIYRDMNNAYSRLDTNINRAAAGSNALAALHPLDFDPADKASFAVGYGHYRNANAAAIGAFYYPNANTMVNVGVSVGNGDPGINAGVSFKLGQGSAYNGVSKAEMAQTIHDQAAEISTIKANDAAKDKRIDALEKENQEMKKQIQEILARLNG